MSLSFNIDLKKKKTSSKNSNKKKRAKSEIFGGDYDDNKDEISNITNSKKRQKIKLTEISKNDLLEKIPEKKNLVIKIDNDDSNDHSTSQEMTTSTDYKSVPVEEFGAAMLRGMGWDGNLDYDSKSQADILSKDVHPDGVGIGAKSDVKAVDTDSFMPLVKLNKDTHD
ncbi:Pre-mRNA-splicing factor spp2 [Maudiozyma exigua]|uniref:Pre-mRNA-splicing factor n=1 Tax=Maudiozyma exigua TaxID=34358 RepID=A0A9P6WAS3_MAUEX|nr:Pre-mRNA-splicing factor spp2 [Kazachstania exigua]